MSYRYHNYQNEPLTLEISEQEIVNRHKRQRLIHCTRMEPTMNVGQNCHSGYPRHMSVPSVQSHRSSQFRVERNRTLPKTCQLIKSQTENQANACIALNILCYQLNDRQAKQTHLANVRRSLERRLQAAKVSGNNRLLALLQQEWQQIESVNSYQ